MKPLLEVASLGLFLEELGYRTYFGDIREGCILPAIYLPMPEITYGENTVSVSKKTYSLFVKIVDKDTMSAYETGNRICNRIQGMRKLIPYYDENGNAYKEHQFKIMNLQMKEIDTGVAQIYMTYERYQPYYDMYHDKTLDVSIDVTIKE